MELFSAFEWTVGPCRLVDVDVCGVRAQALLKTRPGGRRYRPLTPPYAMLWRRFAIGAPSASDCLDLALEFGMLGTDTPEELADSRGVVVRAEHVSAWQDQLGVLSHAALVFDELENGDHAWLTSLFEWRGDHVYVVPDQGAIPPSSLRHPTEAVLSAGPAMMEELAGPGITTPWKTHSAEAAGRFYLQQLVNKHLRLSVTTSLTFGAESTRQHLRLAPTNLVGALWLQLAVAIASGATILECKDCGRPFEISRVLGLRADAEYCSNACKSRHYRKRKRRAQRLAADGMDVADIAATLQTGEDTVRGWVHPGPVRP